MPVNYEHLNKTAQETVELSKEARIDRIRSERWIGYTRAQNVLEKLEDLMTHPRGHRMPNLLLVGDTNNGKTMIDNRFYQKPPATESEDGQENILPVMMLQCPPVPDESRFYDSILEKLFAPYKPSDRPHKKQFQAIHLLTQLNTKVLILDEIHHIIAGNLTKQRHFLNTIKYLGNEMQIPIIGVGTKEAFHAIQTDPQLANRFEPEFLPRWKLNTEFLRLLISFERMLPLKKPSNLTEDKMSVKLLSMCEGVIGELAAVLRKTAVLAVKTDKEQITRNCSIQLTGSVLPSERKSLHINNKFIFITSKKMLTNNVFPIKILPQKDELLSSWLVRLAIAHGQKLHTFTRLLWNKQGIWARDIDKSITPAQIQILADRCGIDFDTARKTALADYAGCVYETHNKLGANPWLTSIGIYHRKRTLFGQQFCPECLAEDAKSYFRRHWRLSFFTICIRHKIQLSDCCFKCSSPVNFHRDELGNYHSFAPSFITRCFHCQFDLRKSPSCKSDVSSSEILFYEKLERAIEEGFWNLTRHRSVHSLAFFAGLRQIVKILSMNDKRIENLRSEFSGICTQPDQVADNRRKTTDFPELRVSER